MQNSENKPLISVLLASYNGEEYILKSIKSVLNQTYRNIELLVGLNGTTDSTMEIITQYYRKAPITDHRLFIYNFEEKGKAKTLNKLLKISKGDWIAIQDDDDIWYKNKVEMQTKYIEHYDVIGTQILYVDEKENSPTIHGVGPTLAQEDQTIKYLTKKQRVNQIANTSAIINKKSLLLIGGWKEDIDGVEDMDLWVRLMNENCNFINLKDRLVMHRIHDRSNFNSDNCDQNLNNISL